MNKFVVFRLVAVGVLLAFAAGLAEPASSMPEIGKVAETVAPWRQVGEGIDYREFYLAGPNHVYVARLDRSNERATIESSIAQGRLSGGLETVRAMAERYDQAVNYWGESWGERNQVVVAINGFFYDPQTGIPQSGQVHSGWYARRFDDRQNGSGFAWTLDRRAFIGGCVRHNRNKQVITLLESGETLPLEAINAPRGLDDLVVYTPQYDANTLTDADGLEILVELSRPMLILPAPGMITGTVRGVYDGRGATPIPFDHVVLSASGEAAARLQGKIHVGEGVGISQELRHFQADCSTPNPDSWVKTYAGVGASFVFLRAGVIQRFVETAPILRTPRTAVAYNEQYIFFIVVDGRDPLASLGMSMVELAVFARNSLGATWGAALDGGGSSTMVVNGALRNHPNTDVDEAQSGNAAGGQVERAVANGLMMVASQPREQAQQFQVGQAVRTISQANLRLGPGTNYAALEYLAPGQAGAILPHPLNGLLAKGTYWWKVRFGEREGWISAELLAAE